MPSAPRVTTTQILAPPTWLILLEGEQDMATSTQVGDVVADALRSRDPVIVDLTQVTFAESSLLAVLLAANERARRRRLAVVVSPGGSVDRLFNLVEARSILAVFPTRDQAIEWLQTDPTPTPLA
jgi:anti-anti-sigma factor